MKTSIFFILFVSGIATGCSRFLDLKPDQKMAIPHTLEHAELLLNDYSTMNMGFPNLGEIAADDYYLRTEDWNTLPEVDEKMTYNWSVDILTMTTQWQNAYKTVYTANQALDILKGIESPVDMLKYNKVLGAAHFFRAFAFHQLASVFTMPYNSATADVEMGIPIRLDPSLDYRSDRGTLKETYAQIVSDYRRAIAHLPSVEMRKGIPNRAASYAGLARVYLDIQDYEQAYNYADSCLQEYNVLLQYNDVEAEREFPFDRFNDEVLFPATMMFSYGLDRFYARVDPHLYQMYDQYDRRRQLYFQHNEFDLNTYGFRGSYDNTSASPFVGLTTSEMYLVRAEAAVRLGTINEALKSLNELLKSRIDQDFFSPIIESEPETLLALILAERRKELVFRGQRWSDLKRLNQDERFKKTLIRQIDSEVYKLEPNSFKYAHLIPDLAITEAGMLQNKR